MLKIWTLLLVMAASLMAMHEAEVDLNNYDLDAKINFDAGQFNSSVDPDTVYFGFRYLYGSHQNSDKDLSKNYNLFDGHFFVRQRLPNARAFTLGLGAKLVFTSIESNDFYALPLGVTAHYDLPLGLAVPVGIGGEFYFAPEVLSWDDAKNYYEYDIYMDVMLIDRAGLTAGYRRIDMDFEQSNGNIVFNESWFVGVKFRF